MLLLLKLLLVPALVAGVTLAARRWGVRVGGVLTGLPLVAGPTLCFYAIEQGHGFAASAARAALLGIAATAAFCVAYAHMARHASWPISLAVAWTGFAVSAALLHPIELGGAGELGIAVASLLIGSRMLPRHAVAMPAATRPRWDVPVRMIAAAAAVVVLTGLARLLGEQVSGILAAFPVVTVILVAFTHVQRGHTSATVFLHGLLRGLLGFALFCIVFSALLGTFEWGLAPATAGALGAQLLCQGGILWRAAALSAGAGTSGTDSLRSGAVT